tara:strand:- start:288 stop:545 length:258 start_codon:yes stop_codon:yes gene_type:complete
MNCNHCHKKLSNRGKSGFCQPCSARVLMNNRWANFGDVSKSTVRLLDRETKNWLLNQANANKVKLSTLVASIIKDAYYDDLKEKL